jgi:intracellular sulfur oxidation DsrE/DsrF family protein
MAITLLFTNNVIADNQSQQKKTVYKVDFDKTKTHKNTQRESQYKTDSTNNEDPELKILLLNRGHALVLEPGAMTNTKLEYGETENSLQSKVTELENQGIKYIICEPPATITKNSNNRNVYNTNISNTTSASELTRLRAMGYKCVEP